MYDSRSVYPVQVRCMGYHAVYMALHGIPCSLHGFYFGSHTNKTHALWLLRILHGFVRKNHTNDKPMCSKPMLYGIIKKKPIQTKNPCEIQKSQHVACRLFKILHVHYCTLVNVCINGMVCSCVH